MHRLAALLSVVLAASSANAAVLCAKARGDGSFSSTVKLRETCAPRESRLDPAALNLQGPPGPRGGASVFDSAHRQVGAMVGQAMVLVATPAGMLTLLATRDGFPDDGVLLYPTRDCSGPAYVQGGAPLSLTAPTVMQRRVVHVSNVPSVVRNVLAFRNRDGCVPTIDIVTTVHLVTDVVDVAAGFSPPFHVESN